MWNRLAVFLVALLLTPVVAHAQDHPIANANFEEGMTGWGMTAWNFGDVYTSFDVLPLGEDGSLCGVIENFEPNDARFIQYVDLDANSTYLLSARVSFEGQGTLNLSVLDTSAVSAYIHDTRGGWTDVELCFRTERKNTTAQIALRVGYYGSLEKGLARFDDVALKKINTVPEGVEVHDIRTIAPASPSMEAPDKTGIGTIVLAGLFSLAALGLYARTANGKGLGERPAKIFLLAILGVALTVRVIVAWQVPGYKVDINCFGGWGQQLLATGPLQFYEAGFCDYPPGYILVLGMLSTFTQLLDVPFDSPSGQLILKLPSIMCDLAACYMLYRASCKALSTHRQGLALGVALVALYALCPAVIADSAAWGQIDSILALLMALMLSSLVKRKTLCAAICFTIGLLIKPQALMFGPILLLAFIHEIVQEGSKGWKTLGKCFGICATVFIAVVLPFNGLKNPIWLLEKYFSTVTSYPYASVNAMNLFALLDGNWIEQTVRLGPLSFHTWGMLFMLINVGYSAFLYVYAIRRMDGDRRVLLISALVLLTGIFAFGIRMHERYLYPALLICLLALLFYKDRRFLWEFLCIGAAQAINILIVLNHQHVLDSDRVLMLIGSMLHIAAALYAGYLGFTICILGRQARGSEALMPFAPPRRMIISVEWPTLERPGMRGMRLARVDILLMISVTLAYSALAFFCLGDTSAPETTFRASAPGEEIIVDLSETRDLSRFYYYGEIPEGTMDLSFAPESGRYSEPYTISYKDNIMFIWRIQDLADSARYAKITFQTAGMTFFEFAFTDGDGVPYPARIQSRVGGRAELEQDPSLLLDEQALVPARPTYMNSMYFDEIYHARTAYEQVHDMPWYENTHPPLGKVFMSWCIGLLGMNPFAWRLAGTLAGILMLPGMYLIGKLLFGRVELAFAAMLLLAMDCMHLTQTRIATIDSFPVLFIIWAYFFMFYYTNMNFYHEKFSSTLAPLFACGLFMGLGCASKWIGIYAAAGLAVILFFTLGKRFLEYREAKKMLGAGRMEPFAVRVADRFWPNLTVTLACCLVFFLAIPLAIYYASYYQYLTVPNSGNNWRGVWNYQTHMLQYHSGVFDTHPYASTWYQWPVIWKPMAFFFDYRMPEGWTSAISSFGNPAIWWAGLAGIIWMVWRLIRDDSRKDPRIFLVVTGFASQYLPWVLVPRTTYIYHYFAAVPFIILCICFFLELQLAKGHRKLFVGYLTVAALLFALFYPVASGLEIPLDFAKLLNWLPSWALYWG